MTCASRRHFWLRIFGPHGTRAARPACGVILLCSCACVGSGCASNASKPTTRPSSVADRQDAALKDPFGYSPDMSGSDSSSGDIGKFDREGMRKDLDHVLNP